MSDFYDENENIKDTDNASRTAGADDGADKYTERADDAQMAEGTAEESGDAKTVAPENTERNSDDKDGEGNSDNNTNAPADDAKPRASIAAVLLDYVEIFVFAIAFVIILFSFGARLCTVTGPSMEDTLHEGDLLLVSDAFYEPQRGDIIVFHHVNSNDTRLNKAIVKRVIATSGETIDIDFDTWTVTITDTDGKSFVLDESDYFDSNEKNYLSSSYSFPYTVPEGSIFVMGDNRNHSTDSRNSAIGPVDERSVLGKVILRIKPFSKFGKVN
ncbi:MAG: signal peptidase I [Eubacteriales bacterium]